MEEEDDEDVVFIPRISTFLLMRVLRSLRTQDREIEDEMLQQAMTESMDTYHTTLFRSNPKLDLMIAPHILTSQDIETMDADQRKCSLCLEDYVPNDTLLRLPCQHEFHSDCIHDAVRHQHATCPICRTAFPTRELESTPPPPPSPSYNTTVCIEEKDNL